MKRAYYSSPIDEFLLNNPTQIIGYMTQYYEFNLEQTQRDAWLSEIDILHDTLIGFHGTIFFEYSIPRMGKRIDVVILIGPVIFVLEFKVGECEFLLHAVDQVWDYALDLKNFHETSHDAFIAPVLIATNAKETSIFIATTIQNDKLLLPIKTNSDMLRDVIQNTLLFCDGNSIDSHIWNEGRYQPTPTIIEAAMALYSGHSVKEISRSDASAKNLSETSDAISSIIESSKEKSQKSICFVTGVPGAGKTLIGLNIATKFMDKKNELYSVFLSGNGPLVDILREALARDRVWQEQEKGIKEKLGTARSEVKQFIQNVHNFRDECLIDIARPPIEHVALFDEAQRAWDLTQTKFFMLRKKHIANFDQSEPDFLISCLNRHNDWAVIVCLVGGGQEINTGEAGISEWISVLQEKYTDWKIFISRQLKDSEYGAGNILEEIKTNPNVIYKNDLHLATSMRSFRNENVSQLVKQLLDIDQNNAKTTLSSLSDDYPIVLTRDLSLAKNWLKERARGSERYGIVASSQAFRLKPFAVDVKSVIDPIHWFLDSKEDVRSSYYLEDVATEFQIQGLELDWACVIWDGDFRFSNSGWKNYSFCGTKWNHIKKSERQMYQKNAYRVLLTRARQGMVIVVPQGDQEDPTRKSDFYDPTFEYLASIGFPVI